MGLQGVGTLNSFFVTKLTIWGKQQGWWHEFFVFSYQVIKLIHLANEIKDSTSLINLEILIMVWREMLLKQCGGGQGQWSLFQLYACSLKFTLYNYLMSIPKFNQGHQIIFYSTSLIEAGKSVVQGGVTEEQMLKHLGACTTLMPKIAVKLLEVCVSMV